MGSVPSWNDFVEHPNYDEFWQKQAVTPYLKKVTVPNLNVAGWWDQEDFLRAAEDLRSAGKERYPQHLNYFVAGPGTTAAGRTVREAPSAKFSSAARPANISARKSRRPWFAYWLKDKGELPFREALTFETGTNQWQAYDRWPPREHIQNRKLYFHAGGKLGFDAPRRTRCRRRFDRYISDPAHPVPYRHRPIPYLSRRRLAHLAGRGSALRPKPAGCLELGNASPLPRTLPWPATSSPTYLPPPAAPTAIGL